MISLRGSSVRNLRWALIGVAALALSACSTGGRVPNASWPGVTAGADRVYVADGAAVYAVDLQGKELWRYPAKPVRDLNFFAPPAVATDGLVYAGSYTGQVFALDAATGALKWEFPSSDSAQAKSDGRIVAAPTVSDDQLLVPTDGGTLYFLDRHTGKTLHSFEAVGQLWSSPRVEGDTVYLASLAHTVYAIDLATAELRWSKDLGYAIAGSPALEGDILLTPLLDDALVALRTSDGSEAWRAASQGWLWGAPAVVHDQAYFGDVSGNVYALDLTNGAQKWKQTSGEAFASSPLVVDARIVFGAESGGLVAYNLETRAVDWSRTAAGPVLADPVAAGNLVIVAVTSKDALLQAFDSATGTPQWNYLPATGS